MGWNPEKGYYETHVKEEGCSNKIMDEQKAFNKLKPEEIREGIRIAQEQWEKDMKDKTRVDLKEDIYDIDKENINFKDSLKADVDYSEIISFKDKAQEKERIDFEEEKAKIQEEEENYRGA